VLLEHAIACDAGRRRAKSNRLAKAILRRTGSGEVGMRRVTRWSVRLRRLTWALVVVPTFGCRFIRPILRADGNCDNS
jgi:hypothetical protein